MKNFFYICLLMGVVSCVSKSEYEKLENDNRKLEAENNQLEYKLSSLRLEYYQVKSDYDNMVEAQRKEDIEKNSKKYVSEADAVNHVNDYYDFYNSDISHRNIKLRRTGNNSFVISIEEAYDFTNIWSNKMYTLIVNNDNTYSYVQTSY